MGAGQHASGAAGRDERRGKAVAGAGVRHGREGRWRPGLTAGVGSRAAGLGEVDKDDGGVEEAVRRGGA